MVHHFAHNTYMPYQKNLIERAAAVKGSIYALCKDCQLDQSNVSKIKRELRPLPLDVLVTICRCCSFPIWQEIYDWVVSDYEDLKEVKPDEPPSKLPPELARRIVSNQSPDQ